MIKRILHIVARVEDGLLVTLLGVMILVSAGQIILRNVFGAGFVDAEPFTRMLVLWIAMIGAVVATRTDKHINIDILSRLVSPVANRWIGIGIYLLTAAVATVVCVTSLQFVIAEFGAGSRAFTSMPAWLAQSVIPLGFGLIAAHSLLLALLRLMGEREAAA